MSAPPDVRLREVEDGDLAILFQQQADPIATEMANFPAREWAPFLAHWAASRAVETAVARAIVADGALVGHIVSWLQDDQREVGYWIGREFWGRGYATRALALLLEEVRDRPLVAHVADHNLGSRRVLEHCGFVRVGGAEADGVRESIFRLD